MFQNAEYEASERVYNPSVFVSHFEDLRRKKAYKEGRNLTLRVIAQESGLALSTVHRVKSGQMERIYLATLDTLCRYFGVVTIGELIEYKPDRPSETDPPRSGQTDRPAAGEE